MKQDWLTALTITGIVMSILVLLSLSGCAFKSTLGSDTVTVVTDTVNIWASIECIE